MRRLYKIESRLRYENQGKPDVCFHFADDLFEGASEITKIMSNPNSRTVDARLLDPDGKCLVWAQDMHSESVAGSGYSSPRGMRLPTD